MASDAGYTPAQRRVATYTPALLLALTLALSLHTPLSARLDACFIYRELERPPTTYIPLADSALHNCSVLAIWAAMIALLALPARRRQGLFALLYTAQWFHVTYILLCALKAPLDDFNCGGRHRLYPNGVSGHYCYFLFVSFSAPLLARARLRANAVQPAAVIAPAAAFFAAYVVGAPATLYRTWAHGYHSPRQILLGSSLGLASHAALERFFIAGSHSPAVQLAVLAAGSVASIAVYQALWPLSTAGPALTAGHIAFHAAMWVAVLASAAAAAASPLPEPPQQQLQQKVATQ
jgi:hypothetical protein